MLEVGDRAPRFTLITAAGGLDVPLPGGGKVVLAFYIEDGSPG